MVPFTYALSRLENGNPKKMAPKHQRSKMDQQIDENLRRVYADTLAEELPEKFMILINKLKETKTVGDKDVNEQ